VMGLVTLENEALPAKFLLLRPYLTVFSPFPLGKGAGGLGLFEVRS
jgi:hypothetical protein